MKRTGIITTAALSLFLGIAASACAQDQRDQEEKKQPEAKPAPQEERHGREDKPAPRENKPAPREEKRGDEAARPQNDRREPENKPAPQEDRRGREDKPTPRPAPEDERRGQPQQQRDQQEERQRQDVRTPQSAPSRQPEPDRRQVQEQRPERGRDQGARQSAFREHRARSWQSEHRSWRQRGGYHGFRIPEDRFRVSFGESHFFRISSLSFEIVSGSPAFLCNGYWVSLVDPIPEYWADDWYDTDDVYITWNDDGYYLIDRRYPTIAIAVNIST